MTGNREYLTDVELENLICELEQGDMVQAPPDMQECIMDALERETAEQEIQNTQIMQMSERETSQQEERKKQDNIIAYKRYRFRVLTTVAASVMLVFLLPKLEGLQQPEVDLFKPLQRQEEVIQSKYATREEALNERGILETWLGGVNIFANNDRLNLFR